MLYMGTSVTYGRGMGVVVETGMKTQLGRIAELIQSVKSEKTPLQRRMEELGKVLLGGTLVVMFIAFVIGLITGQSLESVLLNSVAIAVAVVPEGLPAVVTIALALGAQRMLRRRGFRSARIHIGVQPGDDVLRGELHYRSQRHQLFPDGIVGVVRFLHSFPCDGAVAAVPGKDPDQHHYAEDYKADGMLFCKLLLSPMPHARVVNIDATEALNMPGVKAILTANDLPDPVPEAVKEERYARLMEKTAAISAAKLQAYLAGQECYADTPAVFVMTAVFERMQWRYSFPRAYRVVLLDAGHLCQTFCLVATWLGLAPFCTGRFADSFVEQQLRVDGVTESFVYGGGVGTRPPGMRWAPWPADAARDHPLLGRARLPFAEYG